jgi:hypothetical protein
LYVAQALLGFLGIGLTAALVQYLRVQSSKLWRCVCRLGCSCFKSCTRKQKAEAAAEVGE